MGYSYSLKDFFDGLSCSQNILLLSFNVNALKYTLKNHVLLCPVDQIVNYQLNKNN